MGLQVPSLGFRPLCYSWCFIWLPRTPDHMCLHAYSSYPQIDVPLRVHGGGNPCPNEETSVLTWSAEAAITTCPPGSSFLVAASPDSHCPTSPALVTEINLDVQPMELLIRGIYQCLLVCEAIRAIRTQWQEWVPFGRSWEAQQEAGIWGIELHEA